MQDADINLSPIRSVHFIGVGGVGMSGIARVAHDQGLRVTGSDLKESRYTKQLREAGVEIHIGHSPQNISGTGREDGPDVVVVSTAILKNNPELVSARERGLTIWHRAQMLARLGDGLETLAVAGTHGKTTTSSMLASALDTLGQDPSFLIGGSVRAYGTNARSGTGRHYVVEADESDKSFTFLSPQAVLVTNVEADHLDHYRDLSEIYEKFASFISSVPKKGGKIVVCGDEKPLLKLAQACDRELYTYGTGPENDYVITRWEPQGIRSLYELRTPSGAVVEGSLKQSPGRHNVCNAAGVISLLDILGFDAQAAASALSNFAGVRRRFDLVGSEAGITVVDDYAHHPTEIAATITAAAGLGYKRVVVLFQPHRYSRVSLFTEVLRDEFAAAFDRADALVFMDVYSAGETPVPGVTGKTFLNVVLEHAGHPDARYVARRIKLVPYLADILSEGDLLITMGAGDVTEIGPQLLDELRARSAGVCRKDG